MADDVIGLEAWKAKAVEGAAPADARLLKSYVADQVKAEGGEDSRALTFTVSTGAIDRDKDSLAVSGWDVADFMRNPTILWAHDSRQLPIGKATSVVKRASALQATIEFAPATLNPLAESVYQMCRSGFLRATSVGFLPQEWTFNEQRGGFDFKKQQLLEISIVPVPSNPQALLEAKDAGADVELLRSWAVKTLESIGTEPPPQPEPPAPVVTKAGRVLSSANETRVKAARDACQKACDHLDEVMAEVMPMGGPEDPEEPMDEGKAAPAPKEHRFVVRKSRSAETEAERVARIVREVVQPTVAAEIRRLTGRLD